MGQSNLAPLCGVPEVVVNIKFFILVVGDGMMGALALACGYAWRLVWGSAVEPGGGPGGGPNLCYDMWV
jgi:hypothetical protein